jgi:VWFA-related protein
MKRFAASGAIVFLLCLFCVAQDPEPTPPETPEKVFTEEIKLNITAVDGNGKFVADVKKEDLVINEDGRLHQPGSLRLVPASVLIAMDTGGEIRQKKNITTTRTTAENLVAGLKDGTRIALMGFHDRIEFLSDWTTERSEVLRIIGSRTSFGRRASFSAAISSAVEFFDKSLNENRHLVLITDGLDTVEDNKLRSEAVRRLWQSGITVHVISYTEIEYKAIRPQARIWRRGEQNPKRMPEEVLENLAHALPVNQNVAKELLKQIYQPRLFSILIDLPFIKSRRDHVKALGTSQLQLSALAEYTGGEFLLPESLSELVGSSARVSQAINAQYVVTYSPKRALKDVSADEIREISVTSRRAGLDVRASRRLVVFAGHERK